MKIYLNNAATSHPKPQEVINAVMNYFTNIGSNPGRGLSSSTLEGNRVVYDCRESISEFFHFDKPENVIFTSNVTASLNILIKGCVQHGWHVITSSMEHNSVLRPLHALKNMGLIDLDIIECTEAGLIDIDSFKSKIKPTTKLAVFSHASNIVGTIQPLESIGNICKSKGIFFIVDAAQTAGVLDVNMKELNCSALCFTGHKSLLAPQGIGGFVITDEFNEMVSAFIEGGTGSMSSDIIQPDFLPDKFESGTLNSPGVAGLLEGIRFINKEGLNTIREHEEYLTKRFLDKALNIDDLIIYGTKDSTKQMSVVSLNSKTIDNSQLGFSLDNEFGIMTRTGLHCAPLAHKTIGTYPSGTLRVSFGYFNDKSDIDYCISSLKSIISCK